MNIAALMGASGGLPEQNGKFVSLAGLNGEFRDILQALVAEVDPQTPQVPPSDTASNWVSMLLQLFDPELLLSETPDPTGEALETNGTESPVSLTELMTVLQPLVGQSEAEINLAAQLPPVAEEASPEDTTVTTTNLAILTELSQLITPVAVAPDSTVSSPNGQSVAATPPEPVTNASVKATPFVVPEAVLVEGQSGPQTAASASISQTELPNLTTTTRNAAAHPAPAEPSTPTAVPSPEQAAPTARLQPAVADAAQPAKAQPAPSIFQPAPADATRPTGPKPGSSAPAPAPLPGPQLETTANASTRPELQATTTTTSARPATEFSLPQAQQPPATTPPQPETRPQASAEQPIIPATAAATPLATPPVQPVGLSQSPAAANAGLPDIPALHQIVESVKLIHQQGDTEVRLQLRPESLGQVLVQLHVSDSGVSVRMMAETAQGQTLIQQHLPQLKAAFAAQGLHINSANVDVGSNASAFDTPARQPQNGYFYGGSYQSSTSHLSDDPTPERRRSNLLNSLYSIDFQA